MVAKMISWKKVDRNDEDEEEEVWRKSILMGEKCRPIDFSGQILYDSDGKEVNELHVRVVEGIHYKVGAN